MYCVLYGFKGISSKVLCDSYRFSGWVDSKEFLGWINFNKFIFYGFFIKVRSISY